MCKTTKKKSGFYDEKKKNLPNEFHFQQWDK